MKIDEKLLDEFNRLTGMYGRDGRTVSWLMSNGANIKEGILKEAYPPNGQMFTCEGMFSIG